MVVQPVAHALIATDGSREAIAAADVFRGLINPATLRRITVVSVARPVHCCCGFWMWGMVGIIPQPVVDEIGRQATAAAQEAARREVAALADLPVTIKTIIRTGTPADEIIAAAREVAADLIVVGSRGHGGLRSALLGSVSEAVLHRAPCPVLVVRPTEDATQPPRGHRVPARPITLARRQRQPALTAVPLTRS